MDSRFSHLLLPVSLSQFANYFFPYVPADLHMKNPMKALSPQEGVPAWTSGVKISSPTVGQPIDLQLTLFSYHQANQFILLFLHTTAQACPQRTMASFRQKRTKIKVVFPPSAALRRQQPLLAPLVRLVPLVLLVLRLVPLVPSSVSRLRIPWRTCAMPQLYPC